MALKATIRDLRIAARDGDRAAMRTLLRRNGRAALASEIRRDRPIPPRVERAIAALTAGVGTRDTVSRWEFRNERGEIESLLQRDPILED